MVSEHSLEHRVATLETHVQLLAKAVEQARTWLILVGSLNHKRFCELHDLSVKSLVAIDEVRRRMGGE